ncbi:MAG: hypothetical protein L7V85_07040 [Bacteroidia bacterium]|nr:hypothetical protein [Bacteroidia bacterium]
MENNPKNPDYPDGIIVFPPREGAPEYARGKIIITLADFSQYVKNNPDKVTEYKYRDKNGKEQTKKQIAFDFNKSQKQEGPQESWYCKTNAWQPEKKATEQQASGDDDLF